MAREVDTRVVEMQFDNKRFEENVQESMTTLEKLKQALNFDGLRSNFSKVSQEMSMDGLGEGIDTVNTKFSALQIMGVTALANITNSAVEAGKKIIRIFNTPISLAKSGGLNRALNIEQARFQLKGLGLDIEGVMQNALDAVDGTAYGLDTAAKVASQLGASGMKAGDKMFKSLRAVAGVAAMTSSSYENIGDIFTTVASNGRLMTMQLRQMAARGLNASATLAKYLGKTEAQVNEMVTKGKIDFETFAMAMDDAFGEHAKDANSTFSGALSNVKAALSRIGADFATPYIENMRQVFNSLRPFINDFRSDIQPIVRLAEKGMKMAANSVVGYLENPFWKEWRDEGGVSAVLGTLYNLLFNVLLILRPIKEAWNDIFPKTATKNLIEFVEKIRDFTASLAISEDTSDKLKRTFKGLFAIIDILKIGFATLFKIASPFFNLFKDIGGLMLSITANFGDYLVHLDNVIKGNESFENGIGAILTSLKDIVTFKFKAPDLSFFSSFLSKLKEHFKPISSIIDISKKGMEYLIDVFKKAMPTLSNVLSAIGGMFKKFGDAVAKAINKANFDSFYDLLSGGILVGIGTGILRFIEALTRITYQTSGLLVGIKRIMNNVYFYLAAMQAQLKANVILKIAAAVGILAVSVMLMATVDSEKLTKVLIAITVMFGELVGSLMLFGQYSDKLGFAGVGITNKLLGIAISINILASAMKKIGSIDSDDIIKSMISVLGLMAGLTISAIALSKWGMGLKIGSIGMIFFAEAINILTKAVKALGSIEDPKQLIGGLISVGVLLGELLIFMQLMPKFGGIGFLKGLGFIELAASLLIFSTAVKKIGELSVSQIAKGLIAIGVALAELSIGLKFMPNGLSMLAKGAGLIIIATAIRILSGSIKKLGSMSVGELAKGLIALAIGLAEITIAMQFMNSAILGATTMLIMSAALAILVPELLLLGTMSWGEIGKSLLALAGIFAIVGVAGVVLAPLTPVILALTGAIALLGIGLEKIGVGMLKFSAGLSLLSTSGVAGAYAFVSAVAIISNTIPTIATTIAKGVLTFIATLAKSTNVILDAVIALMDTILTGIIKLAPKFATASIMIFNYILDGLEQELPKLLDVLGDIPILLLSLLSEKLPILTDASAKFIISFINGIADSIENNTQPLIDSLNNLLDSLESAFYKWIVNMHKRQTDKFKEIGENLISGISNGILKGLSGNSLLSKSLKYLGNGILKTLKNILGIHSPSKKGEEEIGKPIDDGIAIGISENSDVVNDEMIELLDLDEAEVAAITNGKEIGNKLSEGVSTEIETNKSKIENGMTDISDSIKDNVEDEIEPSLNSFGSEIENLSESGKTFFERYSDGFASLARSSEQIDDTSKSVENLNEEVNETNEEFEKLKQNITESISSSLDIFSEFDKKTELSAKDMLKNMHSQIVGVTEWADNLKTLADRGIDHGLLQKLSELGPKGFEYVNAFVKMSASQLEEAGDLFRTSIVIPTNIAEELSDKFKDDFFEVGKDADKGVAEGIKDGIKDVEKEASLVPDTVLFMWRSKQYGFDEHSPSVKTYEIGKYAVQGLVNGLKDTSELKIVGKSIPSTIIKTLTSALSPNEFKTIGTNITKGLTIGLNAANTTSMVLKACDSLGKGILSKLRKVLGINSPSTEAIKIGEFFDEGLVVGLKNYSNRIFDTSEDAGNYAVDGMKQAVEKMNDISFNYIDTNPTIRPVLDISDVVDGTNSLNSLFGSTSLSADITGKANSIISQDMLNRFNAVAAGMNSTNDILNEMRMMRTQIADLSESMSEMQMVMDTGAVVGQLAKPMDGALGTRAIRSRREKI